MTLNSNIPSSKRKVTLPNSVRDFVERQPTLPLKSLIEDTDTPVFPYCEYWRRAVAAMLLSGRIAAKDDGFPNMTDVNRICKEANFDQFLFEATGRFLVTAKIIQPNKQGSAYEPAKFSDAFWNHRLQPLQEMARQTFLDLIQHFTPFRVWRPTFAVSSDSLLRHRPLGGGEIRIRGCSAIVQPESAEVLDAIRQHSRLKGYLEAGAPKGYLLIKQKSNPSNFIQRCKELGFKVTILQS